MLHPAPYRYIVLPQEGPMDRALTRSVNLEVYQVVEMPNHVVFARPLLYILVGRRDVSAYHPPSLAALTPISSPVYSSWNP